MTEEIITNELVDSIETHLRLNAKGIESDEMTLDYIKLELLLYKKQKERLSERQTAIFYTNEKSAESYASTKTN